jgi:acid phosphatase family membrane protein YuiD
MIQLFLSVGLTWLVANIAKPIVTYLKEKRVSKETIFTAGGMPSGHTALVVSLATALYLETGFSAPFLIAFVLAVLVMYDAIRVRSVIENLSRTINALMEHHEGYTPLQEHVGHTPAEVLASLILGVILPVLIYRLF